MTGKTIGITESKSIFNLKEYYRWEFEDEEDDRKEIQDWSKNRIQKMHGLRKSYMQFLVYTFNWSTMRSFFENFNFIVILQMILAAGAVWLFDYLDIAFNFNVALFVSPIVFPLAFSINTDFQRREKVLDDIANFKSSSMIWYFCMREWRATAGLDEHWLNNVKKKIHSIMFNLREYLLTDKVKRRDIIARYMYEDFSDISQLIEKVRASKLPANTSIVSRVIHLLNNLTLSFERLRVIREYRSPRSVRSFNKVLILLLPIILCPYFVFLGRTKEANGWGPYYIAVLVSAVFGALQGVQDKLDDPFDGMSEDDINLDTIDEWTFNSLKSAAERNYYKIGRFHVVANIDRTDSQCKPRSKSIVQMLNNLGESEVGPSPIATVVKKSPFTNRKTAKSLFKRSVKGNKKRNSVNRSHTFGGVDVPGARRSRYSSTSSQVFTPEAHPFADVLAHMTGDDRIERKHTTRQPVMLRQLSHDVQGTPIDFETKPKSMSEQSLHSILKEEDVVELNAVPGRKKSVVVSFVHQAELFVYDQSPHLSSRNDHPGSPEDSPSNQPLLPNNHKPDKKESSNRFKTIKVKSDTPDIEMQETSNRERNRTKKLSFNDELQQIVVVGSNHTSLVNDTDNVFS